MYDATDAFCGSEIAHLAFQDRFGPKSGFGMFGKSARRLKGFTLSEEEWAVLTVSSALAFAHWEKTGGPGAVKNNLRFLYTTCRLNGKRSAEGREQKMRLHQLEALIVCGEWYVQAWSAVGQQEEAMRPSAMGERAEREAARERARALIPRLKRVLLEAQ